jgi:hypothetical protein
MSFSRNLIKQVSSCVSFVSKCIIKGVLILCIAGKIRTRPRDRWDPIFPYFLLLLHFSHPYLEHLPGTE